MYNHAPRAPRLVAGALFPPGWPLRCAAGRRAELEQGAPRPGVAAPACVEPGPAPGEAAGDRAMCATWMPAASGRMIVSWLIET